MDDYLTPTLNSVLKGGVNADQSKFGEKCMEFLQIRKRYYKYQLMKEKLME